MHFDSSKSLYQDDLDELINLVLRLREKGKLSDSQAKQILKIYLSKHVEDEVFFSFKNIFRNKLENNKRMLYLKWLNKTNYE